MNSAQRQYYNSGYQRGRQDSMDNRRSDYRRYRNEYNSSYEYYFRTGYDDGYGAYAGQLPDDNYGNNYSVPKWLVGTFRGYTPSNRTYTDMTIYADGRIWIKAVNGSAASSGSYSNGFLNFPWGAYQVNRGRNGFNAMSTSNRSDNVFYERIY